MATNSKIEWTDATWNPVTGCSKVSDGCKNCYAERLAHRFRWTSKPWTAANASENVVLHPERLEQPFGWRKPRRVFVNSMSDLFHKEVPHEFLRKVWEVMVGASGHTFQILTKRPERMMEWVSKHGIKIAGGRPAKNIWLGVSVENQKAAEERIPLLLQTPAAVRFLSCEPLLGPVDLRQLDLGSNGHGLYFELDAITGWVHGYNEKSRQHKIARNDQFAKVDWVIVGGESGPGARPMHPDWVRSIRDQCQAAGVPFFFKQWGEWVLDDDCPANYKRALINDNGEFIKSAGIEDGNWQLICKIGKKSAGRLLDGRTWDEFPEVKFDATG